MPGFLTTPLGAIGSVLLAVMALGLCAVLTGIALSERRGAHR